VDKNKLLFGLIGLTFGFIISFFVTRYINENYIPPAAASQPGGQMSGASGASGTQGAPPVQAVLEKARNNPGDFKAQVEAAQSYYQIGMFPEAIEYLKKAQQIDPKHLAVTATIANLYFDAKNYAEAEAWYRRAAEIKPDEAGIYVEIAATLIQRDQPNPDKAIQEIERALKIDPKDTHALEHLIEAHLLKKDARSAEEVLGRLKQAEPDNRRIPALEGLIADLKAGRPVTIPKEG
jgi:tetratricopeptide (TPR) repeat protein